MKACGDFVKKWRKASEGWERLYGFIFKVESETYTVEWQNGARDRIRQSQSSELEPVSKEDDAVPSSLRIRMREVTRRTLRGVGPS